MTDTPWTPGPWYIAALDDQEEATEFDILAPDGEEEPWHIAKTYGSIDGEKANARLIAAAPEMAAVLSGTTGAFLAVLLENMAARLVMLGASEDDDLVVEARSRATKTRAILARIKGETP